MKRAISCLSVLVLIGSLGVSSVAMAADDGILSKEELAPGSNYCHMQFRPMRSSTLDTDHPTLKSANSGDVIDFYGPCDEKPTGKDQVLQQKLDEQRRRAQDAD